MKFIPKINLRSLVIIIIILFVVYIISRMIYKQRVCMEFLSEEEQSPSSDTTMTTLLALQASLTAVQSQISNLNGEIEEKNALLTENLLKQNQTISGTQNEKNNLGGKLFSWGIGLIGLYYTLKGYLDPETYGVTMAALEVGGIKDDPHHHH